MTDTTPEPTTPEPTDVRMTFALAIRTGTEVVGAVTPEVLDRATPRRRATTWTSGRS